MGTSSWDARSTEDRAVGVCIGHVTQVTVEVEDRGQAGAPCKARAQAPFTPVPTCQLARRSRLRWAAVSWICQAKRATCRPARSGHDGMRAHVQTFGFIIHCTDTHRRRVAP